MNDILYFNSVATSLEHIALAALHEGHKTQLAQSETSEVYLEVYHGGMIHWGNTANPELRQDRWIFDYTNLEDYDIEEDRALVEAFCPVTFLSVQYQVAYLCDLTIFLRQMMKQYGGWVYGADNKIHNPDTIQRMQFVLGNGEVYLDCGSEETHSLKPEKFVLN